MKKRLLLLLLALSSALEILGQTSPQDTLPKTVERKISSVTVRGSKLRKITHYATLSTPLTSFDLQTAPSALADVLAGVELLPAVQGDDTNGRPLVAGGAPEETQLYLDGLLLHHPQGMGMRRMRARSRLSSSLLGDISLQSGGYGAYYGEALSGIIDMKSLPWEQIQSKTTLSLTSVGLQLLRSQRGVRHSLSTQASYTDLQPYGSVVKDSYHWHRRYYEPSAEALYNYRGERWRLKGLAKLSLAGADYSYPLAKGERLRSHLRERHAFTQLTAETDLSPHWSLSLGGNASYLFFAGTELVRAHDDLSTHDLGTHLRGELRFLGAERLDLRLGLEHLHRTFDQTYRSDRAYRMHYLAPLTAAYLHTEHSYRHLSLDLGLRLEHSWREGVLRAYPRFYLGWRHRAHALGLASGRYSQQPEPDQLKFVPELASAEVWNSSIVYNYLPGADKYSLGAFYKVYDGLVTYPAGLPVGLPKPFRADGVGRVYGLSAFAKKTIRAMEIWGTYSYIDGWLEDRDQPLGRPPQVAKHLLRTTFKYWIRSLRSLLAISGYWDSGAQFAGGVTLPNRSSLDLSLSYLPSPRVILHLGVTNLLGSTNYWGVDPSAPTAEDGHYTTNPSRRTFFFGCFITFPSRDKQSPSSLTAI